MHSLRTRISRNFRLMQAHLRGRMLKFLGRLEQKADPTTQFMADTNSHLVQDAHPTSRFVLWSVGIFFVIIVIWSKFAVLDEVTEAEGKVIPASQVQVIQNLEGGIVKKILVHEGDLVEKGQILIILDSTRYEADYNEARMKAAALQATVERLNAVTTDQPFQPSEKLQQQIPDLVRHEQKEYASQTAELQRLTKASELDKKQYNLMKPLVKQGAASEVEVLNLERQATESQNKIDSFNSKALDDLNNNKAELLKVNASLAEYEDRINRTVIRSPVKGIVKQIKINTIGGVSQPGMDIMEIVPFEDSLLVEAQVKPKDIGFIHIGQQAMVKITAYDFSIYGGLEGKVTSISADTISNPNNNSNGKNESFYLIRVRTDKNYLGSPKKPLYIIPGMMASADILTGRKSVLDYLLKPILKARQNALRER